MLQFVPNERIKIDGMEHVIVGTEILDGAETFVLRRAYDASAIHRSRADLLAMYESGSLAKHEGDDDLDPVTRAVRRKRNRMLPSQLSDAAKKRFAVVPKILAAIDEIVAPGTGDTVISTGEHAGRTNLEVALVRVGMVHGLVISRATLYRWRKAYRDGDPRRAQIGDHRARGNRKQMDPQVRKIMLDTMVERLAAAQVASADRRKLASRNEIIKSVKEKIDALNAVRLGPPLRVPAKSTLQLYWNRLPAFERDVARFGPVRAAAIYRGPRGGHPARHPLSIVEYDETRLPFFMFDEYLNVPLGRPWLSWYVCRATQSVLGIYLGFEPASDLATCSAAKFACSTKAWVNRHYPGIENAWEAGGIGREWIFDNSLTAHGNTIESMLANLDAHYKFTRVRSPWLKYTVEGLFDVVNDALITAMPGFVIGKEVDRVDYDPTKSGCIGMRVFLSILFKWLLDVYQVIPHAVRKRSPLDAWREGVKQAPPGYVDRSADLDVIFGVLREGNVNRRLDHNGVVYEDLYYYGPELDAMRRRNGSVQHCPVKINPASLSTIRVYDERSDMWAVGRARDEEYATNLSLHVHKLYQKRARDHYGGVDMERLQRAQHDLSRMISSAPAVMESLRTNARIARAMGIGTQNLFDAVDQVGDKLDSGPFAGMQLDPFRPPPSGPNPTADASVMMSVVPSPVQQPIPGRRRAEMADEEAGLPGAGAAPSPAPTVPVHSPFAGLPALAADKSLNIRKR